MTTKKFIEEMNQEELTKVFNANDKLQNEVLEDMIDSEMYWIGEKLDYVKDSLSDWSVGTCQRSYITVKKMNEFLQGLIEMNNSVPAFNDDKAAEVIGNLQKVIDAYYYAEVEAEDELEELAERAAQEAADELAAQFDRDLNYLYSHDAQLEYFLEFYADARMGEAGTYYIIEEEETYKLYQDVSYVKSY